ncbi:uncharacterized protein (DUF58 family) [Rhodoligotrophos appendicifer]|uniref:DUF58 domain-containing protein n=1 Tax=Rhodoligotrophos appendicifer TaxID=987056 RepID=UPI0011867F94|nr:DUF58 domain-containing protein [Rhodoligotrophos appendicifer]
MAVQRAFRAGSTDPFEAAGRLANAYPALLVEADRIAHTVAQGFHGRRRPGTGESFWQFQQYRQGEEASRIDWRKSARSDQLYVRQNEWEAANTIWMWANSSAAMEFQSRLAPVTKRHRAQVLLLALSALMLSAGERVGILGSGRSPVFTRNALSKLAAIDAATDVDDLSGLPPRTHPPRYSSVVLISDFLMPIDELRIRIGAIAARDVKGHLVQVFDPAEETLPYTGRKEFEDVSGLTRFIVGRAESVRQDYRQRIEEHRQGLKDLARRLGWTFTLHHTDRPPQQAMLALYGLLSASFASGSAAVRD